MKLVTYPNKALEVYCQDVKEFNQDLHDKLDAMLPIMDQHKGMGLAANQVGLDQRFFIMKDLKGKLWEFINPEVLIEFGAQMENESCLSFPGLTLQISRPEQISVRAYNRNGEEFNIGAVGKEAICIYHEIEHLNGTTFLNNLSRQQRRDVVKRLKK